jgi:hypothetical protein
VRISWTSSPGRARALFALTVTALSFLLWLARWESPKGQYLPDSYAYANRAYEMAGYAPAEAGTIAMSDTCMWLHHRVDQARFAHACHPGHARLRPEYAAIFRDRVGFPGLVALMLPALHRQAFVVATALCAVLSALVLAWIMRLLGASRAVASLAVVLLFNVRGATWLARVGSEAPALVGILGVVAGLLVLSRPPTRRSLSLGLPVVTASALWLLAVRPSSGVLLSLLVVLVYGTAALVTRDKQRALMAAGGLIAAGVDALWMRLRHSPGLSVTLQDTFTRHFSLPPVSGLGRRYLHLLLGTCHRLGLGMLHHPVTPLIALIGTVVALRLREFRLPALCVVALAVASAATHPIFSEVPRLISPGTSVEAVGLAMGLSFLARELRSRFHGSFVPDPVPSTTSRQSRGAAPRHPGQ